MKKILVMLTIYFSGLNAFAGTLSCRLDSDSSVLVAGVVSEERATIQISDKKEVLGIRELNLHQKIEMARSLRKREDQYSFAKYYVDFNAWQDIEISVPKNISGKNFKAFLTVYGDNGDRMLPGLANKLSCVLK